MVATQFVESADWCIVDCACNLAAKHWVGLSGLHRIPLVQRPLNNTC